MLGCGLGLGFRVRRDVYGDTYSCDSPTKMVSAAVRLSESSTHDSMGLPASLSMGLGMLRPAWAKRSPEPPMGMSTFIPSPCSQLAAGADIWFSPGTQAPARC